MVLWYLQNQVYEQNTILCRCQDADSQVPSVPTPLVYLCNCLVHFALFLLQIPGRNKALPETQIHFLDTGIEDFFGYRN